MNRKLNIVIDEYVEYDELTNNEHEIYQDFNYRKFLKDFYFKTYDIKLEDDFGSTIIRTCPNIYNFMNLINDKIVFCFTKTSLKLT